MLHGGIKMSDKQKYIIINEKMIYKTPKEPNPSDYYDIDESKDER